MIKDSSFFNFRYACPVFLNVLFYLPFLLGYFGNEAGSGCVYAKCAIVVKIPVFEERTYFTDNDINEILESILPAAAFDKTRSGMSKLLEDKAAMERVENFAKSSSYKKPKSVARARGRGWGGYDDEERECVCF